MRDHEAKIKSKEFNEELMITIMCAPEFTFVSLTYLHTLNMLSDLVRVSHALAVYSTACTHPPKQLLAFKIPFGPHYSLANSCSLCRSVFS